MTDALGGQTVTVYAREKAPQRGWRDTGETVLWPGCSVQPLDDGAETGPDRRSGETRRWRVFAPPGCRAPATAQCIVEPGPADADGVPLRLDLAGSAQPHWDLDGVEDHVTATVHLITTGGDR